MQKIVGLALLSVLVLKGALLASVPQIFDAGMAALLAATTPARTPTTSSPTSAGSESRPTPRPSESFNALFGREQLNERRLPKA